MSDRARNTAFSIIRKVFERGAYSNIEISNGIKNAGLEGRDKAFCVSLVNGVTERVLTLDYMISRLSDTDISRLDAEVLAALRLGLYQIFYMDVPDSAACDESVKLLRERSKKGFANAVLRRGSREKEGLAEAVSKASESVRCSVGEDICRVVKRDYAGESEEILCSFFAVNPSILRVNRLKIEKNELKIRLETEGAEVSESDSLEDALIVKRGASAAVALAEEGLCFFQGLSSQRAVESLGAKAGETVIDVCACPGGKSFGAALDMNNRGRIISLDIHGNKLSLIEKGALRLGIDIIETREHDGREPSAALSGIADRVICDVPCSGIGAIKGRPEIRYKSLENLGALLKTQRAILRGAFGYLKPGGTLIYSTCTINKEENEAAVREILKEEKRAELIFEETVLPTREYYDGFYIAKLIRV